MRAKLTFLGTILPIILILDLVTKRWAESALASGRAIDLFGGLVPLTLAFNRGAAFGIRIGSDPRWFFIPITLLLLFISILQTYNCYNNFLTLPHTSPLMRLVYGNVIRRTGQRLTEGVRSG